MNNFYVEMDSSLMHTMNIPQKFAKMLKGSMSENIELEGPSGITWHVKIIRSNNIFSLRSGWKDFVTANRIDKNDILVFTYNGDSSFKVIIFDRNGCEKVAPFFAKKIEIVAPHREVKKEIVSLSSGNSDTDEYSCEVSTRAARARTSGERVCGQRKQRESSESGSDESETDEEQHGPVRKTKTKETRNKKASRLYIIPQQTFLTKAQEEIANRMARKTQKGSDLFVKILTSTDTPPSRNCVLRLPVGFACKVLESKKKITLLPADSYKRSKTCTANYYKYKNGKCIGQGWRTFVCRNGLKQGDLCLFELRKQEKQGTLTMIVHFNRVGLGIRPRKPKASQVTVVGYLKRRINLADNERKGKKKCCA